MSWDADKFQRDLDAALDSYDRELVSARCGELVAHVLALAPPYDERAAHQVLGSLQRKRYFDRVREVADALMQAGLRTATIRRRYAQALIDQGELAAAVPFLRELIADTAADAHQQFEHSEARGLMGRAHKQCYVTRACSGSTTIGAHLNESLCCYLAVYEEQPDKYNWHGINAAALLLRGARDGVAVDGIGDAAARGRELAGEILQRMTHLWDQGAASMWDCGTAMEACVALGKHDEAREWLERYVAVPRSDAFELASTLRQLEQIWDLRVDTEPGSTLLPLLRAELLKREGGGFKVSPSELRHEGHGEERTTRFEKVLGTVRYHNYRFMLEAIARARSVVRIEYAPGQGLGTGFVVNAEDLCASLAPGLVVLTNAHVVSPDYKDAMRPEDAIVTFQLLRSERGSEEEYRVEKLEWSSPPLELDATVLRLDGYPQGIEPIPIHARLPLADGEQRVYVIGHPKGGELSFSIQDNLLLDHESPYLHYRAPTEGGSSGSPVFNSQWRLIGLHHAGAHDMQRLNGKPGRYAANEGIWIQAVAQQIAGPGA